MTSTPINLAIFRLQDVCVHVQKGLRKHLRTAGLDKAPQIDAVFRWLRKRGVRIALLSDFNPEETNILLERLNWPVGPDALIEFTITNQRSQLDPIAQALQRVCSASPGSTLLLADTPRLLQAAARLDIGYNIGVTSGSKNYQALRSSAHDALLDAPLQLVNFLLDRIPGLADGRGHSAEEPELDRA